MTRTQYFSGVVSMTTSPERFENIGESLESLLTQSLPPRRVDLFLESRQFSTKPSLPGTLSDYGDFVTVHIVSETLRSKTKLLPATQKYPLEVIVTVDDDIVYNPTTIMRLMAFHTSFPSHIVSHTGRVIPLDDTTIPWSLSGVPYPAWDLADLLTPSPLVLPLGVGGVLYPSGCLDLGLAYNFELGDELARTCDDIWFWYLSQACGTKRACLGNHDTTPVAALATGTDLFTLNGASENRDAFDRIFIHDAQSLQALSGPIWSRGEGNGDT